MFALSKADAVRGELFWNAQSLFTTSVPDGKVSAPSARAINSETPLFERQGRQNGGGLKRPLKINMVSNSERRCWDGNICGLCTRRGHSSADRIVQSVGDERNWVGKLAVKQRRTRRHFEYSNKHFDLFLFETTFPILFAPPTAFISLRCRSLLWPDFDDAAADISIHVDCVDNCWAFFQQQTNIYFFFLTLLRAKTRKIKTFEYRHRLDPAGCHLAAWNGNEAAECKHTHRVTIRFKKNKGEREKRRETRRLLTVLAAESIGKGK